MNKNGKDQSLEETKCEILPEDISEQFFLTAFGSRLADESARIIISYCQKKKSWASFSREEIDDFARKKFNTKEPFVFNGLCDKNDPYSDKNFIKLGEDNKYRPTKKFIQNCLRFSPAV